MSDQDATYKELQTELKDVRIRQRELVAKMNRRYKLEKKKRERQP